jgi:monomeric isocitrate dehydrogenase
MSGNSDYSPLRRVTHYDNRESHFLTFSCYRQLKLLSKDQSPARGRAARESIGVS